MADHIATISGTMLVPGVSRNRRLYTKDLIGKAVARMQERIKDPAGLPIVMRTHHEAGDDSRLIVGHLTSVKQVDDGSAKYAAVLNDTKPAQDIANLVTPKDPSLRSVSIHGYWIGPLKRVQFEGQTVETADDIEIDAVDFTGSPGVTGAVIDTAALETTESAVIRTPIAESMEATVAVTEAAPEPSIVEIAESETWNDPFGEAYTAKQRKQMAAKKQAMDDGSYPIKNKADLRRAIRAVGRGGADHDKIRAHVISRAKALGMSSMIPDNWNADGSLKEAQTRYSEVREYYPEGPSGAAGFCVDAYNGPLSITLRACGIDPTDLRAITTAAMSAACDALQSMDKDMDGDIDVPGADGEDTDGDAGETAPSNADAETVETVQSTETTESTPATGESTNESEVPAVSEATEKNTPPEGRTLSEADLTALGTAMAAAVGTAVREAMAPAVEKLDKAASKAAKRAAKATEETAEGEATATAAEATAEEKSDGIKGLREALLTELRDELREEFLSKNGTPQRKGYRVHENDQATKSPEELFEDRAALLLGDFAKTPVPVAGTGSAA